MATLTGNAINTSYQGLIKTTDNATITATGTKSITDGEGNASPLKLSQQEVHVIATEFNGGVCVQSNEIYLLDTAGSNGVLINNTGSIFGGAVDFSAATVTGLPAGAAGLESGTGTDSMQSAASLTTTPANASGNCSIALGNNARALGGNHIAIGKNACAGGNSSAVAIGNDARSCQQDTVAIGLCARADAQRSIAIGRAACTLNSNLGIAIGNYSRTCANVAIQIGSAALNVNGGAKSLSSIAIGSGNRTAIANGEGAIALGGNDPSSSCMRADGTCAIAIGYIACSLANGAVALGYNVTANKVDTVTVRELETCVAGGGITMKSPNGTEYKLTVDDAGSLVIT